MATFRSASNSTYGTPCPEPAGAVDGDVLVAHVHWYSAITATPSLSGWNLASSGRADTDSIDGCSTQVFTRVRSGATPNAAPTFSNGISNDYQITIAAFSGVDTTSPIVGIETYGDDYPYTATSWSFPSQTASAGDIQIFGGTTWSFNSPGNPTGYTSRVLAGELSMSTRPASGGATGTTAGTKTNGDSMCGVVVLLRNAAAAVTGTPNFVVSSERYYQPSAIVAVLPNFVVSDERAYQPTALVGVVGSPNFVASDERAYAPMGMNTGINGFPNFVVSDERAYQPVAIVGVMPAFVPSDERTYAPDAAVGVIATPNLVVSDERVYAPSGASGMTVFPGFVSSDERVRQPSAALYSGLNIVVDMNSLGNGVRNMLPDSTEAMGTGGLQALRPTDVVHNVSRNGTDGTTQKLIDYFVADVVPLYDPTRVNVVYMAEAINSFYYDGTSVVGELALYEEFCDLARSYGWYAIVGMPSPVDHAPTMAKLTPFREQLYMAWPTFADGFCDWWTLSQLFPPGVPNTRYSDDTHLSDLGYQETTALTNVAINRFQANPDALNAVTNFVVSSERAYQPSSALQVNGSPNFIPSDERAYQASAAVGSVATPNFVVSDERAYAPGALVAVLPNFVQSDERTFGPTATGQVVTVTPNFVRSDERVYPPSNGGNNTFFGWGW